LQVSVLRQVFQSAAQSRTDKPSTYRLITAILDFGSRLQVSREGIPKSLATFPLKASSFLNRLDPGM
jgi:hypothetical protein